MSPSDDCRVAAVAADTSEPIAGVSPPSRAPASRAASWCSAAVMSFSRRSSDASSVPWCVASAAAWSIQLQWERWARARDSMIQFLPTFHTKRGEKERGEERGDGKTPNALDEALDEEDEDDAAEEGGRREGVREPALDAVVLERSHRLLEDLHQRHVEHLGARRKRTRRR